MDGNKITGTVDQSHSTWEYRTNTHDFIYHTTYNFIPWEDDEEEEKRKHKWEKYGGDILEYHKLKNITSEDSEKLGKELISQFNREANEIKLKLHKLLTGGEKYVFQNAVFHATKEFRDLNNGCNRHFKGGDLVLYFKIWDNPEHFSDFVDSILETLTDLAELELIREYKKGINVHYTIGLS